MRAQLFRSWSDVECLGESPSLCEISMDGNPISAETNYKQIILKNMSQLRQLDMKRVTVSGFNVCCCVKVRRA